MKRLRVLHIDSGRKWRGGQRQVFLLAQGLVRRGHAPLILAPPDSPLLRRAQLAGLDAEPITIQSDWDLRAAREVRARIHSLNADVVHAHDARSHAIARMALIGLEGPPFVVTRRITYVPKATRLKYGNRVSRFIAVSVAVAQAMVSGGIHPHRIDVIHSGIDDPPADLVPRDWRAELGWPEDCVICGVVGAMTHEKGVAELAEIAAGLDVDIRSRIRILLLGGEQDGHLEIGGATGFAAGFVEDIIPAVAGIDVLWHPARAEGLGTAVIDAMSLGVPPVAFAVGGIAEVVENEVSGLLVAPEDVQAFAQATERLIREPGLGYRLSEAARLRAGLFTAARMTDQTAAVYDKLVSGSDDISSPSNLGVTT